MGNKGEKMKNYFDLTGDVAVVTGASSGLGVQFSKALANQGAKLALFARREDKLKNVTEKNRKRIRRRSKILCH